MLESICKLQFQTYLGNEPSLLRLTIDIYPRYP